MVLNKIKKHCWYWTYFIHLVGPFSHQRRIWRMSIEYCTNFLCRFLFLFVHSLYPCRRFSMYGCVIVEGWGNHTIFVIILGHKSMPRTENEYFYSITVFVFIWKQHAFRHLGIFGMKEQIKCITQVIRNKRKYDSLWMIQTRGHTLILQHYCLIAGWVSSAKSHKASPEHV